MGRTKLSPQRLSETRKINIGKVIIFCEGKTEKFYFDYFAEIVNKTKYTDIEVVLETANGNAKTVLNYANTFLSDEGHNRKFSNYSKYLVFDCDAPPEIQTVINDAYNYELLVSNHFFELWLLMHFEEVDTTLTKRETYRHLNVFLHNDYSKGHKGKTREIITNGSIEKAIDNAIRFEQKYKADNLNIFSNIDQMNPYTNVYKLVEQFMAHIS